MTTEQRLTKAVKRYDKDLVIKRATDGKLYLMRNTTRWDSYTIDGQLFHCSRPELVSIFALTHDWSPRGQHVDMGIERLMTRIKEIDAHRSEEILERVNADYHQAMADKEKGQDLKTEAFAHELRGAVKHDFKDFCMSSSKSIDPRAKIENKLKRKGL